MRKYFKLTSNFESIFKLIGKYLQSEFHQFSAPTHIILVSQYFNSGQDLLDIQSRSLYSSYHQKQCLIKYHQSIAIRSFYQRKNLPWEQLMLMI